MDATRSIRQQERRERDRMMRQRKRPTNGTASGDPEVSHALERARLTPPRKRTPEQTALVRLVRDSAITGMPTAAQIAELQAKGPTTAIGRDPRQEHREAFFRAKRCERARRPGSPEWHLLGAVGVLLPETYTALMHAAIEGEDVFPMIESSLDILASSRARRRR